MNRNVFPYFVGVALVFLACSGRVSEERVEGADFVETDSQELPKLEVVLVPTAPLPDATIEMYRPLGNELFPEGKVAFEFNIKNYPFGSRRPVMLSINGADAEAVPHAVFSKSFSKGTYRAVAYLTDENGFLLKDYGNYVDRDFRVGDSRPFPAADEPYLLLNRPNNGEKLALGEGLPIDFLVVWGDMKADGLEVKVSLGDFEYKTQEQQLVTVKNLAKGEHVVRVDLQRKDGRDLSNAFSSVSRRIVVE